MSSIYVLACARGLTREHMVCKNGLVECRMWCSVQAKVVGFMAESVLLEERVFGLNWQCQHFETCSDGFDLLRRPTVRHAIPPAVPIPPR